MAFLAVLALAAFARTREASLVFVGNDVVALDPDSQYHLYRAERTLAHFPHVPSREPLLNWPAGAFVPWGPGFDQLLALPAFVARLRPGSREAGVAMAFVPVAIGLAVVIAVMRLAWTVATPRRRVPVSLAAGFLVAMQPISVYASRVGRTDHHGFEALAVLVLVSIFVSRERLHGRRASMAWELGVALGLAALVHVYTGTILSVGVLAFALVLRHGLPSGRGRLVGSGGPGFAGAALVLAVADAPYVSQHRRWFDDLHLSFLQPSLLLIASLAIAAVSVGRTRFGRGGGRGASVLASVGFASMALVGIGFAVPAIGRELVHGLRQWLFTRDPWMASIAESQPLFSGGATRVAIDSFGWLGLALLVAQPLAIRSIARHHPRKASALALFVAVFVAATLLQNRFGRVVGPLLCVGAGIALDDVLSSAARRVGRRATGVATVAFSAALLFVDAEARGTLRDVDGIFVREETSAAWYLRDHTPDPGSPPRHGRRHGVLTSWSDGHTILALGHRPVLVANFGPYTSPETFREVEAALSADETTLLGTLDRHDAGYIVIGTAVQLARRTRTGREGVRRSRDGRAVLDARYVREMPVAAMLLAGSGVAARETPHLERLRPIFASLGRIDGLDTYVPSVLAFERVAGALLEGAAPDGTRVVARIPLRIRDRLRLYEAWTVASGGRIRLRVPLPTGWNSGGGVSTGPLAEVRVGDRVVRIVIPDAAVVAGRVLSLPATGIPSVESSGVTSPVPPTQSPSSEH